MNLTMLLEMVADTDGDRLAVGTRRDGLTYRQLYDLAQDYAGQLDPGHRAVGYLDVNSPDFVALLFACATAGVPLAPVNYRWTDAQIGRALGRIAPVAVWVGAQFAGRLPAADGVERLVLEGKGGERLAAPDSDEDVPAVLLFTSGTSGDPKAAILRNRHLVPYVVSTVEFMHAGPEEAILVSVPPYHIAAVSSVLTSVYSGRRMVQLPAFDPHEWVDIAREEAITHAMVVPTMLGRILDVLAESGQTLSALRHLSYGGGRMPTQVVERALTLLPHVDLVNAYGLTETSSTISVLGPGDHRAAMSSADPSVRARLGSVGRAIPSVSIEIRDEHGAVLAPGRSGEIWVRGEQVSGEYLTHSAIDADGWYATRDHGYTDVDGFLFLQGRADDVIVRGGENISPTEIEDRLHEHPSIGDVAVVGVPDVDWGERIEAVIVLDAGQHADSASLRDWVRGELRSSKVPARFHIWNELPYNEAGKLLRREVRARLAAAAAQEKAVREQGVSA